MQPFSPKSSYLPRNGFSRCFLSSGLWRLNRTFRKDWIGMLTLPSAEECPSSRPSLTASSLMETMLWSARKTRTSELSCAVFFSSSFFWFSERTLEVGTMTS